MKKIERGKNEENKLCIFNVSFIIEKSISLLFPFMKGVQIKIRMLWQELNLKLDTDNFLFSIVVDFFRDFSYQFYLAFSHYLTHYLQYSRFMLKTCKAQMNDAFKLRMHFKIGLSISKINFLSIGKKSTYPNEWW